MIQESVEINTQREYFEYFSEYFRRTKFHDATRIACRVQACSCRCWLAVRCWSWKLVKLLSWSANLSRKHSVSSTTRSSGERLNASSRRRSTWWGTSWNRLRLHEDSVPVIDRTAPDTSSASPLKVRPNLVLVANTIKAKTTSPEPIASLDTDTLGSVETNAL